MMDASAKRSVATSVIRRRPSLAAAPPSLIALPPKPAGILFNANAPKLVVAWSH